MTGRNHMVTGVWGVGARNVQHDDEVLMPAFFKAAGYQTGYFGKRDGIYTIEQEVWDRGVDEASHVTGYRHKNATSMTHRGPVQREGWTVDVDVDTTLDYIARMGDKPWWCTTAFILPHLPWEADERFTEPYREIGLSETLASYYGCVTQVDDAIGRLLQGLEDLGQADNTIVIFFSDNGPSFRGLSDDEIANRNPRGLRGWKSTIFEHGILSPLMIRWPGKIEPGDRPQFVLVEDLLPTLIELAGLDRPALPEHQPFDGIDISDAIMDPNAPETYRRQFLVAISGEGRAGNARGLINDPRELTIEEQHLALRGPRFKWHNFADGSTALYDLEADPGETVDVSNDHPSIARMYAEELEQRFKSIVETERAYHRPVIKVGRNQRGHNRLQAAYAQWTTETLKTSGFNFITSFQNAGETARYAIDVTDAGRFRVELQGRSLNAADQWSLQLPHKSLHPAQVEANSVIFEDVSLSQTGQIEFSIGVSGDAQKNQTAPILERIQFQPARR
jgi:arylsulfatase A-like enzyme